MRCKHMHWATKQYCDTPHFRLSCVRALVYGRTRVFHLLHFVPILSLLTHHPLFFPNHHCTSTASSSTMAFVSAIPLVSSQTSALTGRSVSQNVPTRRTVTRSTTAPTAIAKVEFQTYSGGLDRLSIDPYSITRYLFKNAPASLTDEEKDSVIAAGLRQLFGNAYLMEEERAEFYTAESKYRCGDITAKEFARAVGKSDTYRKRFFESVSQYRFIELNFKHFLGRAPLNQVEYSKHFKIFADGGYEAEIDSYFDDEEYDDVFGEDYMPYTRFKGTYAPINQFNRMCSIEGGFAGSDKFKPMQIVTSLAANVPTPAFTVADGLPVIPNSEHPSRKYDLPSASLERFQNELEIAKAKEYALAIELKKAYSKLDSSRNITDPFKTMVSDMDITPLYGINYGNASVKAFSGQYEGAPAGGWGGASGVENINGPTRRPAAVVGTIEKKLERTKQLIVDLERRVATLEAERESPALTPTPMPFEIDGVELPITAAVIEEEEEEVVEGVQFADTVIGAGEDFNPEDDDSGVVVPKPIVVSTKREFADVGKLPGELIEEMTEKKNEESGDFMEGRPMPKFPGDGSEMIIGG